LKKKKKKKKKTIIFYEIDQKLKIKNQYFRVRALLFDKRKVLKLDIIKRHTIDHTKQQQKNICVFVIQRIT